MIGCNGAQAWANVLRPGSDEKRRGELPRFGSPREEPHSFSCRFVAAQLKENAQAPADREGSNLQGAVTEMGPGPTSKVIFPRGTRENESNFGHR